MRGAWLHGLQFKAEDQEEVTYLTLGGSPAIHACACVLAHANKRLTILITYTHPDQSTQAHLRGQHPMTASEPPANWGADSRVDDDVVCRVEFWKDGTSKVCKVARPGGKAGSGAAKQNKLL